LRAFVIFAQYVSVSGLGKIREVTRMKISNLSDALNGCESVSAPRLVGGAASCVARRVKLLVNGKSLSFTMSPFSNRQEKFLPATVAV
jgi:hypothetical protein